MLKDLNKFNNFIKDRNKFSSKTFGPKSKRGCIYPLKKLREELEELIAQPKDKMEWADCMLCILDASWRAGYTFEDLVGFCIKKLEINKKRKFIRDGDGLFKHVKGK